MYMRAQKNLEMMYYDYDSNLLYGTANTNTLQQPYTFDDKMTKCQPIYGKFVRNSVE